ncbi:MAG: hypothetical protein M2R45_04315 [Verrucomicrobia subdivision 3 bacterium]|nr:hypothetical protein [Limisphaerales bacterium]MCS1417230.1 hypothetical protein [Limisphaerales bacterium]
MMGWQRFTAKRRHPRRKEHLVALIALMRSSANTAGLGGTRSEPVRKSMKPASGLWMAQTGRSPLR